MKTIRRSELVSCLLIAKNGVFSAEARKLFAGHQGMGITDGIQFAHLYGVLCISACIAFDAVQMDDKKNQSISCELFVLCGMESAFYYFVMDFNGSRLVRGTEIGTS